MSGEIYPYQSPREVARDLFVVDGSWKRSPLGRRMTIVRREDGALAIHSAIRMKDGDWNLIDRLGRVDLILVPNTMHSDEARYYRDRYPEAKLFVPAAAQERLSRKLPQIDRTYEAGLPGGWSSTLAWHPIDGTKFHEAVFLHRLSRTLIVCDLVFHYLPGDIPGFAGWFMNFNGAVDRIGPTKILRWFFMSDRERFDRSLQPLFEWEFDRIVMSHGRVIETGGKERFVAGYRA